MNDIRVIQERYSLWKVQAIRKSIVEFGPVDGARIEECIPIGAVSLTIGGYEPHRVELQYDEPRYVPIMADGKQACCESLLEAIKQITRQRGQDQ